MFSLCFLCACVLLLTEKEHLPGGWGPDVRCVSLQALPKIQRGQVCMWAALRPQCMGSALRRRLPLLLFSRSSLVKALGHAGPRSCSTRSQQLQLLGLAAPQRAQSSQTRDRTRVPCIGRWSLIHWTAREVPSLYFQMLPHPGALGTYGDSPLRAN